MKRTISLAVMLFLLIGLAACSADKPQEPGESDTTGMTKEEPAQNSMPETAGDSESVLNIPEEEPEKWVLVEENDERLFYYRYHYDSKGNQIGVDEINLAFADYGKSTIYRKEYNEYGDLTADRKYEIKFSDQDGNWTFDSFYYSFDKDMKYTYTYGPAGNVLTKTEKGGEKEFEYSYDQKGNLLTKKEKVTGGEYIYEYTYDSQDRLLTETKSALGRVLETTKYEYLGDVLVRKWFRDESEKKELTYIYDENGAPVSEDMQYDDGHASRHSEYVNGIIARTESHGAGVTSFQEYDEKGYCVRFQVFGGPHDGALVETEREYDSNGRIVMQVITTSGYPGDLARLNGVSTTKYTFDNKGRMVLIETTDHSEASGEDSWEKSSREYFDDSDGRSYTAECLETNSHGMEIHYTVGKRYLPLSEYLKQDSVYGVYRSTNGEQVLTIYPTLKEDCYFAVLEFVDDGITMCPLIDSGRYCYMELGGSTYSDVFSDPTGTFEFDGNDIIRGYMDSSEPVRYTKIDE